ncbi:MAG: dihydropyrimidine dehydrogenase subunit A [Armatimonadota bacterium]|nr:MAG: dihydropyrimidine dehydrogenase subunit A [Armatimonadota bacterium]
MADPKGFLKYTRETAPYRPVEERKRDWLEVHTHMPPERLQKQAARCMDCGVPFCHLGCPLGNIIPDWNDLVYRNKWHEALRRLHATNNFPEFTGRLCPAPCETACVLGINQPAVTIKQIEEHIIEYGFEKGWVQPEPPPVRTGKRVAVVGSGPAGLAAAQQLNRAGHWVTVFERADRIGGLLRYGIPDFKLDKKILDRRLQLMEAEGIQFQPCVNVGVDLTASELLAAFDAVLLTGGSTIPRDLKVPGRELKGIHFAMEYLTQQNRANAGDYIPPEQRITAEGKRVVIIGGGDTGADCLGTAIRQGAKEIYQIELLPKPPLERDELTQPWPTYPMILRTSSAHEEGGIREWSINTKWFEGDEQGNVKRLHAVRLEWYTDSSGRRQFREIPGSEFSLDVDLVLLAMGFLHPQHDGLLDALGVEYDERGNVKTINYATSVPGVFAAGDMRRGQSLIVWAISEGREAAHYVDKYLMGRTYLPLTGAKLL